MTKEIGFKVTEKALNEIKVMQEDGLGIAFNYNEDKLKKVADVVFVPLEDGDRIEALIKNKKKVIVVDLNPLSRSAQKATITIVDNIVRAVPLLIKTIKRLKNYNLSKKQLEVIYKHHDNKKRLNESLKEINRCIPSS